MKNKISILILFILSLELFICAEDFPIIQEDELKIENIMNRKFMERFSVPQFQWLNNGKIFLAEKSPENGLMQFVIFDTKINQKVLILKSDAIIESLKKILKDKAPKLIPFPNAINESGDSVAYLFEEDVYLIKLQPLEIKRLTDTKEKEEAIAFSPNGEWISFIRKNNIFIINTKTGEEKQLTYDGTDTLLNGNLSWVYWEELYNHTEVPYQWSPDSNAIAYLQTNQSKVPTHTFVHHKPRIPEVITQHYPKVGQTNPIVRLGIVNIHTINTIWVKCHSYEYIAGFKWFPNSQQISLAILNRKQNELYLLFANIINGNSQLIIAEHQEPWVNLIDMPYFFMQKSYFLWLSERDTHSHIYLYDYKGRLLKQITKGNFNVSNIVGSSSDKKNTFIYFVSNRDSFKERHLYRINLDGTNMIRITKNEGFHHISYNELSQLYLDTYSNISTPPSLKLYKSNGTPLYTFREAPIKELEQLHFIAPKFSSYKNKDGIELPAIILKPNDFEPSKKYPVIIYVYGGPRAQQVINAWSSRHLWANILAREGFIVVTLELRAGLNSSILDEYTQYKRAYSIPNLDDILSAIDWLCSLPYIDNKRIGIWGWSGGGSTTLFAMTHSNAFKAGISVAPVSDLQFYDTIYMEKYMSTPDDNPNGYEQSSSVAAAKNLKGHLLIIHGTYDDNVHPQNTYAFIDQLIENNIHFEIMIYPWRQHTIADTNARIHLYTIMLNFWKKYL